MKPQTFTWKKLTADELTRVYLDEMRRDFPPSELKPLSMILNSEAVGMAHTWGVFEGETLVSYLLMVRPMGCEVSQLDYFSVLPAYRSTGIGARLLAALPAHEEGAKAILIEAECPEKADDEAMAVRRLGFYARCGAVDTGWTEHLFDAWFRGGDAGCGDGQQRAGRLLQPGDGRGQVAQICPALPPGRHGREILIRS
jgi:GNAT superfamily N-acetyltransferase